MSSAQRASQQSKACHADKDEVQINYEAINKLMDYHIKILFHGGKLSSKLYWMIRK